MFNNFLNDLAFYLFASFRFVDDFNGIYQFITTGMFLWTILCISSSLLAIQMQLVRLHWIKRIWWLDFSTRFLQPLLFFLLFFVKSQHIFGFELINTLFVVFYSFACHGILCTFGDLLTHQFNVFNDELCMCNWYLFPIDLQRMLLIFIINTQQPAIIHGFADTVCTRDAFKQVWRF